MTDKAALRRHIADLEKMLPGAVLTAGDAAITAAVLSLPEYMQASCIFVFCGVGREPDTQEIIRSALAEGKIVAVPYIVSDGRMEARVLSAAEDLIPGAFGIPTAPGGALLLPEEIDLLLVPGAAFDVEGRRLGRGGGYYDRYLPRTEGISVGLIRDFALLEMVPAAAHDVAVDIVVTDKKIARPR